MKKVLITLGSFIGVIAGIVVIKMLNLPVVVTIILVAALLVGMIVVAASQMGGKATPQNQDKEEDAPVGAQSSSEGA